MPTKPAPTAKRLNSNSKGKGLLKNKKVLYIGGGALLIVLFLYYRAKKGSSPATDTTAGTGVIPLTTVTPQQAASAGTPSPNSPPADQLSPSTSDALGLGSNDYVTNTDLNSQISGLSSDLQAALAGVTFYSPGMKPATLSTATKSATVSSTAKPAPIKYYTYAPGKAPKGKVSAPAPKKGQTLHFAKGKGYYLT